MTRHAPLPGADELFGGPGVDFVSGDDGDDVIFGNFGSDTLLGGAGGDYINGDNPQPGPIGPQIDPSPHADTCFGASGLDTIVNCEVGEQSEPGGPIPPGPGEG